MVMMSTSVLIRVLLLACFLPEYYHAEQESCSVDGNIRLLGGPNEFEGRVEVCIEGVWSRWCGSGVNNREEAGVVCRQLHNSTGEALFAQYGTGSSSSFISNVTCSGNESRLTDCTYDNTTLTRCNDVNDVGVLCKDPTCPSGGIGGVRLTDNMTESEGRVEICTRGVRAGLCCNELFDVDTATVLCRELGLNTSIPGVGTEMVVYRMTISNHSCSGSEQEFRQCRSIIGTVGSCPRVRLDCSEQAGNLLAQCPGFISTSAADTPGPTSITSQSSPVSIIVGVVCGIFAILLVCLIVILIVIVLLKRRKTQATFEKDGITNINYDMTAIPPQEKPTRTVHNSLYTQAEIPAESSNNAPYESIGPPQVEYATLEDAQQEQSETSRSPVVPQHTLLHSTVSSDGGSHAYYSNPNTPVSNNKSGGGRDDMFLDVSGYSEVEADQSYSKLNVNSSRSDRKQENSGEDQYSHIDDEHKYSKLSEQNSKGYSQLGILTSTDEAVPYEIPTSPDNYDIAGNQGEGDRVNPYATLEAEVGDTGYSKLHVLEEESDQQGRVSQQQSRQDDADDTSDYNKLGRN